jgi:hypothetical protein
VEASSLGARALHLFAPVTHPCVEPCERALAEEALEQHLRSERHCLRSVHKRRRKKSSERREAALYICDAQSEQETGCLYDVAAVDAQTELGHVVQAIGARRGGLQLLVGQEEQPAGGCHECLCHETRGRTMLMAKGRGFGYPVFVNCPEYSCFCHCS